MVAASGCLTHAQQALHEAEAPSGTGHYETRRGDGAQDAKRLGELVMQQAEQYIANML